MWVSKRKLLSILRSLKEGQEEIMARIDDVNALLAAMNTATNAIAAKIADLIAQIQAGGLTDAEEQQVIASLQEQVARLEALAANPNDPIPNP